MEKFRQAALVSAICLGTFMASLDISIVNVALPAMQTSLQTDMAGLQWVIDAYTLMLSSLILSSGTLGDRYGRKKIWLCGVGLFTLGSLICTLSATLPQLLAGRIIQGVAAAAVIPGALSLLTHAFPLEKPRMRAIGLWSAVSALSLIAGPILGGAIVHAAGWPFIFAINIPLGLITFVLGYQGLSESAHPRHAALDPAGQILSFCWLAALVYGLIAASEYGWLNPRPLLSLTASALLFLLFIYLEKRVSRPLIPADLFRRKDFTAYSLASAALGFSAYSSLFFVSLFLQRVQGLGPLDAGWKMSPEFIAMAATSMTFGLYIRHLSIHTVTTTGYVLTGFGLICLSLLEATSPYMHVATCLAVLGAGMGLAIPGTGALVMATAAAHRTGLSSAIMNACRQAGMSLGIALCGALMNLKAIDVLSIALGKAGFSQHAVVAQRCVVDPGSVSTIPGIATMIRDALASGFSRATLLAGAVCIAAALWLMIVRSGTGASPRPN